MFRSPFILTAFFLALVAVGLGFFWEPQAMGLPVWSQKAVIAALMLASLILYRTGCRRCRS